MTVLMWHRRDLRLGDNPALTSACAQGQAVIPLFIFDPVILARPDTATVRVNFLLESLRVLAQGYQKLGGRLVFCQGEPLQILTDLVQAHRIQLLCFNEDIEPFALARDQQVRMLMQTLGVRVQSFQELCLQDLDEIRTQQGTVYGVYGPFWRNWSSRRMPPVYPTPTQISTPDLDSLPIPSLADLALSTDQEPTPAGELAALQLLEDFCVPGVLFNYDTQRNFPAELGTSRLSPHLRMGTIGIRTVWQATKDLEPEAYTEERQANLTTWRQELCWREFYKYTLYHFPYVETGAYQQKYDRFEFSTNTEHFEQWCQGATGYPLVDAAMAQLNSTGWMHNRCRMVVASFLTKDLLLDWRWGERYFMQKLVDGDLAANSGGWQWSASVGTDPKPLRIFNPQTQLARFDPEGRYVRQWLPQLAPAEVTELIQAKDLHRYRYPRPIVDHKKQQQLFKERFQQSAKH